jgi:hypothetical protein
MFFKLKKFLYVLNDLSDLLLKKDREKIEVQYDELKRMTYDFIFLLSVSLILNVVCIIIIMS